MAKIKKMVALIMTVVIVWTSIPVYASGDIEEEMYYDSLELLAI